MSTDKISQLFSGVIQTWRTAEGQRTIYGVEMIQTQNSIDRLFLALQKILDEYPTFSVMKIENEMAIVLDVERTEENPSGVIHIPFPILTLPKIFDDFKLNSIAIHNGLTREEINVLFDGLSTNVEEIEVQGGLKGFLQDQGVEHLMVDQLHIQLLKEDEEAGVDRGIGGGSGEYVLNPIDKSHEDVWMGFISGELNTQDLTGKYKELLGAAKDNPKVLEKAIKTLLSEREDAPKLFVAIEQKLKSLGFSMKLINITFC